LRSLAVAGYTEAMFSLFRTYDIDSLENRDEALLERVAALFHRVLTGYFRAQVRGLERIPPGAGLYVGNHSGGIMTPDSFVFGAELWDAHGVEYLPYGLGHEFAISAPLLHQIIVPLGAVRASHENADRLFARGHKVIVYPGGDIDSMRPSRRRHELVFGGRTGYIRAALRNDVPVIPVVSAGGHDTLYIIDDMRWMVEKIGLDRMPIRTHVWPLTLSIPWGLTLGPPPIYLPWPARIIQEVLAPITFDRSGEEAAADPAYVRACADEVEGQMQATLTRLGAEVDSA